MRASRGQLKTLFVIGVVCIAIGLIGAYRSSRPNYTAQAFVRVSLPPDSIGLLNPSVNPHSVELFITTQEHIIRSPMILDRVLQDPNMRNRVAQITDEESHLSEHLGHRLKVDRPGNGELLRLELDTKDPKHITLSQAIVNAVAQEYLNLRAQERHTHLEREERQQEPGEIKLEDMRPDVY